MSKFSHENAILGEFWENRGSKLVKKWGKNVKMEGKDGDFCGKKNFFGFPTLELTRGKNCFPGFGSSWGSGEAKTPLFALKWAKMGKNVKMRGKNGNFCRNELIFRIPTLELTRGHFFSEGSRCSWGSGEAKTPLWGLKRPRTTLYSRIRSPLVPAEALMFFCSPFSGSLDSCQYRRA